MSDPARALADLANHPAAPNDVVLVHGTRTSARIWDEQVAALEAAGHHAVAVTLPGHGDRASERFTLEGALATIDDAVRGCHAPPLLVGLSLGGYVSLAYAALHQDRVAAVMLSGCSTELRGKPLTLYRRAAAHITRALRLGGGTWHVVTDMLTAMAGYSPLRDLRRLGVPVWMVNGRRDPLRLDERRYLRARPGLRRVIVPRAGHDVNSHAPAAFNQVLLQAVTELLGRRPASA